MFGDFLTLGFDQILNNACKFEKYYNYQVKVPLVIRTQWVEEGLWQLTQIMKNIFRIDGLNIYINPFKM